MAQKVILDNKSLDILDLLPPYNSADEGKILGIKDGKLIWGYASFKIGRDKLGINKLGGDF